jgi:hypothetical protein
MLHKIKYHLINPIKNLIRWFPIIWKDRDWDDYYIWEILKTKLKHQSQHIGENDIHTRAKHDAQRMMLCVCLIEKIQDEYYDMEYLDYCKDEFNWLDIEDKPNYKQLEIVPISENFDEYFAKYKSSVKKILNNKKYQVFHLDGTDDKKRLAMNIAHYNQNKAQTLLFKILDKDIRGWWD